MPCYCLYQYRVSMLMNVYNDWNETSIIISATTMMRCELDSPNKNAHLDVAIQLFDNVHEDVCRQACEVMQARGLGHLRYLRRECIIFKVQFESLVELDQYWDTNSCPEKRQKLSKDLGKVLITDEIKKAAKDAPLDIKIQTNLSYEEYLSKRRHFMKGTEISFLVTSFFNTCRVLIDAYRCMKTHTLAGFT